MFWLGNALVGLAQVLGWTLEIYQWIVIARAVVSWVSADPRNPIVQFLYMATEPLISRVRRLLPASLRYFPLDIAFFVVFGIVIFLRYWFVASLIKQGLLFQ